MFWLEKKLDEMTHKEWESLCDGCGKCCLHKVEDVDTGTFYSSDVACTLLDTDSCQCSDYKDRHKTVPDCITLTAKLTPTLDWLPDSCAYRLVSAGKDLPQWHYLKTGSRDTIHQANMSVRKKCVSENEIVDLESHVEAYFNAKFAPENT